VDTLSYKTISVNKTDVQKEWYIVDATDQILGRLASIIAIILRGKNKANFTPHVDCGDKVIIINAEKIRLTGKKWTNKLYVRHTGYPSGQRFATPSELLAKNPAKIIEKAIKGMLPKNKLGNQIFRNLYVYVGSEHPHQAQKPKTLDWSKIK
jgi:large subunit ribosomal protein L13